MITAEGSKPVMDGGLGRRKASNEVELAAGLVLNVVHGGLTVVKSYRHGNSRGLAGSSNLTDRLVANYESDGVVFFLSRRSSTTVGSAGAGAPGTPWRQRDGGRGVEGNYGGEGWVERGDDSGGDFLTKNGVVREEDVRIGGGGGGGREGDDCNDVVESEWGSAAPLLHIILPLRSDRQRR
ncbi:hypothetical protein NL676_038343 [Syzygium grande]|nr:hypothetical protein NL676_038343 [Syzygium grande]